jgi:hypothetical protein
MAIQYITIIDGDDHGNVVIKRDQRYPLRSEFQQYSATTKVMQYAVIQGVLTLASIFEIN